MGFPDTFEGFMVESHENWSTFKKAEVRTRLQNLPLANEVILFPQFTPKPFGDHDLDIAIDACGVCGSDVHTITGGWGDAKLPVCVGHEIVGRVVRTGPNVSTVRSGDRVGVGAQVGACLECRNCKLDNENYCAHGIGE
jgi:alcohol dehydrogenase (NADP+)